MIKTKTFLILAATIMFVSCDPEFEHEFRGKIISKGKNEPIENVKLEYKFYPIESIDHWRANIADIDSIAFTNENGEFEIEFSTITMTFDSLQIGLSKGGYIERILVSPNDDWKSGYGFNRRKIQFNFGEIELQKK